MRERREYGLISVRAVSRLEFAHGQYLAHTLNIFKVELMLVGAAVTVQRALQVLCFRNSREPASGGTATTWKIKVRQAKARASPRVGGPAVPPRGWGPIMESMSP